MRTVARLLAFCALAACAPSHRSMTPWHVAPGPVAADVFIHDVDAPPCGSPVIYLGAGDVAFDLRASSAQVDAGTAYVLHYMRRWAPSAPFGLHVRVVEDGSLFVGGAPNRGARDNATGNVVVTYGAAGDVYASEWEIPMVAQRADDPLVWNSWTWGTWGPIYPGMPDWALELTR